jgi:hypothetical protein
MMRRRDVFSALIFFGLCLAIVVSPVFAYRPGGQNSAIPTTVSLTGVTTSAQLLPVDYQRSAMQFCNNSAANACAWSWGSFGAAVVNGAGSFPLGAGACQTFDNTKLTDSVNVACSASSNISAWSVD